MPSVSAIVPTVPVVMMPLLLFGHVRGRRAVVLHGVRRGLAGHQRDVVVHAEVAGAVVVGEERSLLGQRLPQVAVLVEPGEGLVVGLVLQDDQPHVLDRSGGEYHPGCRGRRVNPPMRTRPARRWTSQRHTRWLRR